MYLVGVVLACAVAFWIARQLAVRLNWPQRKLVLYVLVFAPLIPLAAPNKDLGSWIAIVGFLVAIPSFIAVLTAPGKA